ncbi:MAG TPA: glycosyltransferase family 4 protein, partial [Bryobacteraceae bacterium]
EREKGCETLLRTARLLRGRDEIELHVAGSGSYEKQFEGLARQLPNVRWHGFVSGSAKQELLSQADVFLQLSECRENAPLGLLEAQRYGLYLVGTRIGGIPEQIDSPETGRLIPAADPQALFETLEELRIAAPGVRNGRAARICRGAGYGMRQMAEQYVQVFESILES